MVGKLVQSQAKPAYNETSNVNLGQKKKEFWDPEISSNYNQCDDSDTEHKKNCQLSYIPICAISILLFLVVLLPLLDQIDLKNQYWLNKKLSVCQDQCMYSVVESIPEGLIYPNSSIKHPSTFETWKNLIQIAEHSIEIGSFYWTLRKSNDFPNESEQGEDIYNDLINAGLHRNITIKIAQNKPSHSFPANETSYLIEKGAAEVKFLDFDALIGTGVLHTKFWIVDRKHLYIGSANMDWRALTQVKELGIVFYNCSCVAEDLGKIFDTYWAIGNETSLPITWPDHLSTIYNSKNPLKIKLEGLPNSLYISSAPPQLSAKGRNDDLDALLKIIRNAKKFIHISVMDYLPLLIYSDDLKYWSVIDEELRKAVVNRNIEVRLLTSKWPSTREMEFNFLRSLLALNKFSKTAVLEVKLFRVPSNPTQEKIPFARVNHNKYMVTDNGVFIGTSNWSGDYFISTAGVSLVSYSENGTNIIQEEVAKIFERDWNSPFAKNLTFE